MVSEDDQSVRKGKWTSAEDAVLADYIDMHGVGNWKTVQRRSGLNRSGQSCRERWHGHLKSSIKKGVLTFEERLTILDLHQQFGNKWARIATHLPGRTDTAVRNHMYGLMRKDERIKQKASEESERVFSSEDHTMGIHCLPLLHEEETTSGSSGDPHPHPNADADQWHVFQNEMHLAQIEADLDQLLGNEYPGPSNSVQTIPYSLPPENLHEVVPTYPGVGDLDLPGGSSESPDLYADPLLNYCNVGTHAEHSDCVQYSESNEDPSWEVLIQELLF